MAEEKGTIAGFRVLRRIGGGRRSDVYLGARPAGGEPVAIKVFRSDESEAGRDAELSILTQLSSPALPSFVDVSSIIGGGLCVIVEHLSGPTLAQLIAARRHLADGEIVTLLAPLVVTISQLHGAGFGLGAITPRSVRFTADGRPVITSLHDARSLTGLAPNERNALLRADYGALAAFVDELAGLVERASLPVAELLHAAQVGRPLEDPLPAVERRLFAWAHPTPMLLGASDQDTDPIPARLSSTEPHIVDSEDANERVSWVERAAGWADDGPFRLLLERLRTVARNRRRPLIVAGVLAAVASTALLVTVPTATASRPVDGPAASSATARPARATSGPGATPRPGGAATPDAITLDDPLAAAAALIAARASCLDRASLPCLSGVDEAGSPAAEADAAAIHRSADAVEIAPTVTLTLSGRSGDAVVVSAADTSGDETRTASLLLLKDEAGWRLREVFVD